MAEQRATSILSHPAVRAFLLGVLSSSSDEDDDEDVPSQDVDADSQRARRRPRKGFVREKPRFPERQGHARWYGDWGTGFWGQYVDRANVENHPLLMDEFKERFRIPHDLFCDFEDEMTTAGLFQKPTKSSVRSHYLPICTSTHHVVHTASFYAKPWMSLDAHDSELSSHRRTRSFARAFAVERRLSSVFILAISFSHFLAS